MELGSVDDELELSSLSSVKAIALVSLPAIVLNAAPPLTIAVQTALCGRYAPTAALAAFAAVGTCVAFVARAANFLVDGVSSKVGNAVGQRAWAELSSHVQLSVRWSLLLGAAAVPLLLATRGPVLAWLVGLSEEVQAVAASYWMVRSITIPFQLLCMSGAGVLQGFGRVRVNAALASAAALLEMAGSAAVLARRSDTSSSSGSLLALGFVTLTCQVLQAGASLLCIVALPPPEASGRVSLLRDVFGLSSSSSGVPEPTSPTRPDQPLLADGAQPASPSRLHCRRQNPVEQEAASLAGSRVGAVWFDEPTRKFLRDGLDMFLRTLTLQATFIMALAAAARLGTVALAAHSIVGQCWVLISYAVDGFAAAAIVLGSRLAGCGAGTPQRRAAAKRHMQRLTGRVLWAGGISGLAAGLVFHTARGSIPHWFTADPAVVQALQSGGVWEVLAAAQPLNGLLFVADGLMYATGAFLYVRDMMVPGLLLVFCPALTLSIPLARLSTSSPWQAFRYVRDMMVLGLLLIFCPALALALWLWPGLAAIWLAKAALNVWRLGGALLLVYGRFLPSFGEEQVQQGGETARRPKPGGPAGGGGSNGDEEA